MNFLPLFWKPRHIFAAEKTLQFLESMVSDELFTEILEPLASDAELPSEQQFIFLAAATQNGNQ